MTGYGRSLGANCSGSIAIGEKVLGLPKSY